jgi:hypothetical protein
MKVWFTMIIGTALLGLSVLPAPVVAQQKTVRACQEGWRANKAEKSGQGHHRKGICCPVPLWRVRGSAGPRSACC